MSRPNYRAARNAALKQDPAPTPLEEAQPRLADPDEPAYPADWHRGQLLNVRNAGSHYNVTLLGEEYDVRHPERCLQFQNSWECQNFVSWWYQPQGQGR